jgi:hypothetical protein
VAGIQWKYTENIMEIWDRKYHEHVMGYNEDIMGIYWTYHGNIMGKQIELKCFCQ